MISRPMISRAWGRITRIRRPRFLVSRMIARFQKHYRIDMNDYRGSLEDYPSLASFFIRCLDPLRRPLIQDDRFFLVPADGFLQDSELVRDERATQVKGINYSVSELIGRRIDLSTGWHLAVIYLSPSDYHRFHYPATAELVSLLRIRGRLFPVNLFSRRRVAGLYTRNERVVAEFKRQDETFFVVAVGASLVGSIKMEAEAARKPRPGMISPGITVQQTAEMGRFEMGSTIIMLVPAKHERNCLIDPESKVRVGQPFFPY